MARVTLVAAKAAAALAAIQLTTIIQDDTLAIPAVDNKNNHTPLRKVQAMFLYNAVTGVYVSNDAYFDEAYAGQYPTSGIESGRQSNG